MALLLPTNLMDPDGVIGRMVGDVDETDWDDVQILGWMYQYYNAEVKDAFFASKAKETPDTIGPATQLFTPDWIVRYMVQNSLGRLWMLNNPGSPLRDQMEYYIEPDAEHEDFVKVEGPEDITLCDPACGSAHILVYAFELLVAMYRERGYRDRDIPELILTKNLAGMEIDPRAAQIAGLALAMRARELDRRFFRRGVRADIAVLRPVTFEEDELPEGCALAKKRDLLDALAHLDEVGSLLCPDRTDLAAIRGAMTLCESAGGLFAATAASKLERALDVCEKLARSFDCVVANPPYMGSSSFGPFMSKWVKKNYPDVKSDLCTCFIERGFSLARDRGYAAMITMQSWMFLGSFEKMRSSLIGSKSVLSMLHLGPRAFDTIGGEVVNVTADVVYNGCAACEGAYVRLVDINGSDAKRQKALEAIRNPDCGWFYRRDAEAFRQVPGTPIAYWASDALLDAFRAGTPLGECSKLCTGLQTGDNDLFVRYWWEPSRDNEITSRGSWPKWAPLNKGGNYRKWYGNTDNTLFWENNGEAVRSHRSSVIRNPKYYGQFGLTWGTLTVGPPSMRYVDYPSIPTDVGCMVYENDECKLWSLLGLLNSSVSGLFLQLISPGLHYTVGPTSQLPVFNFDQGQPVELAKRNTELSRLDWDSFETSWDFKRHPLV